MFSSHSFFYYLFLRIFQMPTKHFSLFTLISRFSNCILFDYIFEEIPFNLSIIFILILK